MLVSLPFLAIFILAFISDYKLKALNFISLTFSGFIFYVTFVYFIMLWYNYTLLGDFSFLLCSLVTRNQLDFSCDGISVSFMLLTNLLIFLSVLYNMYIYRSNLKMFSILLFFLQGILLYAFATSNLLCFFIFFESVLISMFLIVGLWGSRQRKIHALYYLFFYTLAGSVFFFIGILYLYNLCGVLDYFLLLDLKFSFFDEFVLFILFLIGFFVKIPMWPFHI